MAQEIIELSDSEDDGILANGADQSLLSNKPSFFPNDSQAEEDADDGTLGNEQDNGLGSSESYSPIDDHQICLHGILEVFPDISHNHVRQLYDKDIDTLRPQDWQINTAIQRLIEKILDGGKYPKERDQIRELKRKRSEKEINQEEEEAAKWKPLTTRDYSAEYARLSNIALREAFPYVPAEFISDVFREQGHYYGSFFAILKAEQGYNSARDPPFARLKTRRPNKREVAQVLMEHMRSAGGDIESLKNEIDAALQRRKREDARLTAAGDAERVREAKDLEHIARGEVMDCGCCCETVTIPKLTHCNGEDPHFFCLDCARKNANNDIGNSQYKLCCMDFSGCKATFSREQRLRFLDEKTIEKLERLQQQDEIRLAELDNLWTCPFCDFAAIVPPIEQDREFRCHNPQCEEVSCRICKLRSHIPLTCDEHKKENGVSERRVIEEARTEALIRTCGKCKVRILKEDGCNKVVCTSCYAVLCDYCGEDISKAMYNHFDGETGRAPPGLITVPGGKCPLYDGSNRRKDQQVDAAEKEALAKVRLEHPELSEDDLKIKFAETVQQPTNAYLGPNGMYHAWHPRHAPPPRAQILADLAAIPPFDELRRQRLLGARALELGVGAAARPAGIHGGQPGRVGPLQQTAHQRRMALLQQQDQLRQQQREQQRHHQRLQHHQRLLALRLGQQPMQEPWANLHIPQAQNQGVVGEGQPGPFAMNPPAFMAEGPFDGLHQYHHWGNGPPAEAIGAEGRQGGVMPGQEAGQLARLEAAALLQPRPPNPPRRPVRRNALIDEIEPRPPETLRRSRRNALVDDFDGQAALNNPWLR